MAGSDFDLKGGRIGNANRSWAAAQDVGVVDWNKANDFIIAAMVEALGHSGGSSELRLEWRNLTDGGTWTVLGASGQLKYGATNLVDGNAVIHSEEGVTATYPSYHDDGRENEGSNARTITVAQYYHEEDQHSVSPADALDGKEYEFRIYDVGESAVVGTLLCTITMATGGPSPGWNQIQYTSEPPTPNAWNQLKQDAGTGWKKLLYEGE